MATFNRNPITHGALARNLFRLAGPMFVSALLQNAQSLIDLFWVGRLGPDAVAALALSGSVLFLLFPLVMGLSIGTVALVARAVGASRPDEAAAAAGQSMGLALIAGGLVGSLGILGMDPLLRLMGGEPAVNALARDYLGISFGGFFTVFLLMLATGALQAAGNTLLPMTAMILSNLINMALDPVLIFGRLGAPALGVRGAAWATLIAQTAAGALVAATLFHGSTRLKVAARHLVPDLRLAWRIFRIGIFSAAQMLARSLAAFALFRIVASCGTVALAGYGIGMRFHQIVLMPCFVLGNAAAALVGQNLGAARPDRAVRAGWIACAAGMTLNAAAAATLLLAAAPMIGWFTDDPAVIQVGVDYLVLVSPFYIFAAMGIILGRGMNGAGDTVPTMLITILTLWGIQVPLAHGLAGIMTPATTGVWWSIAAANTFNGLLIAGWFRLGRWKRIRLH